MNNFASVFKKLIWSIFFLITSFYSYSQTNTLYAIISDTLAIIDVATGDATAIDKLTGNYSGFAGLTYNPEDDLLYAITNGNVDPILITIDRFTAVVTQIGNVDQQSPFLDLKRMSSLSFNPIDGKLYGAGYELNSSQNWFFDRRLFTIDPSSGDATFITDIFGTCTDDWDVLVISESGAYVGDYCPSPAGFYSVDLVTGSSTLIAENVETNGSILALSLIHI